MAQPMDAPPPMPGPGQEFGSWGSRVVAAIIDGLPILAVYVVFAVVWGENTAGGGSVSTNLSGGPFLLFLVIYIAWLVYNWGIKQGSTGQTLGKGVMNIAVYKTGSTETLGTGLSIGRTIVHIIDGIPCYLGYLWPLWDKENRTFTDMILDTRVYKA
jgi:uncharacterized RDD family membrane protein YckC